MAAYYGQADTVRELLGNVPATVKSEQPNGQSLVPELGLDDLCLFRVHLFYRYISIISTCSLTN